MAKLNALPCSTFLNVLRLLEAYIGPENDGQVMIYAYKGSGYIPIPSGPRFSFKTRDEDEMVTALEIETGLNHLRYSVQAFIDCVENLQLPPLPKAPKANKSAKK